MKLTESEAVGAAAAGTPTETAGTAAEAASVSPRQPGIFELVQQFSSIWPSAKLEKFTGSHPATLRLHQLDTVLKDANDCDEWSTKCSTGQGLWATIPWLAYFNSANSSIQFGLYAVYLFRADMSGVYLTIGQGVSRMMAALPRAETDSRLAHITSMLQPKCLEVLPLRFSSSMQLPIDLQAPKNCNLAKNYEKSAIAWAFYEHFPRCATEHFLTVALWQMSESCTNAEFVRDLECCLKLVNQLQLSPEYFEISSQLQDRVLVGEAEKRNRQAQKRDSKKRKHEGLGELEEQQVMGMCTPLMVATQPVMSLVQQTSAPPACEPLMQMVETQPVMSTSAPPACEPLMHMVETQPVMSTSAPPACEPLVHMVETQPIAQQWHTAMPVDPGNLHKLQDPVHKLQDPTQPSATKPSTLSFELLVQQHMGDVDAAHTIDVLADHNVQIKHLLLGLGFNHIGPTAERRAAMIETLTKEYNSKPSMKPECAETLVDVVISCGCDYM